MPTGTKKSGSLLLQGVLALTVILAIGLGIAYWPRQSNDDTAYAAAEIAKQCAGGHRIDNSATIASGLSEYLTKASGTASVKSEDVGTVTSMLKPDGVGLEIYKAYTQCLKDQTEAYLTLKGTKVVPEQPAAPPEEPMATQKPNELMAEPADQVVEGYVYYEENDGATTEDGVFEPYPKAPLPRYDQLSPGMVLRTVRAAEIRNGPTGTDSPYDTPLSARQCVRVVGKPDHPPRTGLRQATSGGRILVAAVSCTPRSASPARSRLGTTRLPEMPGSQVGRVVSVNQTGGITAGQIGELNIGSKP